MCNALHARWFAEIYFQCFGVKLLNVWGFCLGQIGMLKNGFTVECWLGHVQAFHEQIKLGQNIIGIDMNIQTIHLPLISGFPWINFIKKIPILREKTAISTLKFANN